jgi:hypothetical protein
MAVKEAPWVPKTITFTKLSVSGMRKTPGVDESFPMLLQTKKHVSTNADFISIRLLCFTLLLSLKHFIDGSSTRTDFSKLGGNGGLSGLVEQDGEFLSDFTGVLGRVLHGVTTLEELDSLKHGQSSNNKYALPGCDNGNN